MKKTILLIVVFLVNLISVNSISTQEVSPTKFNGTLFYANTTSAFFKNWTNAIFSEPKETSNVTYGDGSKGVNWVNNDYSRVADLGIIAITDSDSDFEVILVNTSTGVNISRNQFDASLPGNSDPFGNCMFYRNSSDAICAYSDSTDNTITFRMINKTNGTTFTGAIPFTYTQPETGTGDIEWYKVQQRPTTNETLICGKHVAAGNESAVLMIINKTNYTLTKEFNWTSNETGDNFLSMSDTDGNLVDCTWNSDGTGIFVFASNASITSGLLGNLSMYYYNYSENAIRGNYIVNLKSSSMFIQDIISYAIPNRPNNAIVVIQGNSGNAPVAFVVVSNNGTTESGAPTPESSAERDSNAANINIGCYVEETTNSDIMCFYVDAAALNFKYLTYTPSTQVWSHSTLDSGFQTPNFASDDIEYAEIVPCPEGDCAMISTLDFANDIYSGIFWNGTNISTTYTTLIEPQTQVAYRKPFGFLFAPNMTALIEEITPTEAENLNNTCIPSPDITDWIVLNKYLTCNINYTIDKAINQSGLIVNAGTFVVPKIGIVKAKKCIFNGGTSILGGKSICG